MTYGIIVSLALVFSQSKLFTSQNIYCEEAVKSVKIVTSCPTSKTEWDIAAFRKNCSGIASRQNCVKKNEKFQYHCVINGMRNKLVEVCAPTRIIFGHCVEFNVRGGVIQDQRSAPCNKTFPKCDKIYPSSEAFKYPDCYELVSISEDRSSTKKEPPTTLRTTTNEPSLLKPIDVIIPVLSLVLISIFAVIYLKFRRRRQRARNKLDESKGAMLCEDDNNQDGTREVINIKTEEDLKAELNSQKHDMNSIFKRCLSMGEISTNICPYKIREHSDTFLTPSVKDFETRWRRYGHRRNCSALF